MDRRAEERFQVYSPARVIRLDDTDREMECFLTDISASGLRLLSDENLPSEGIILVEAENHLVLCNVRNSMVRGNRFSVGTERIHTMSRMELPPASSLSERTEAVIQDFHLRLRKGLAGPNPVQVFNGSIDDFLGAPQVIPKEIPDQIVEGASQATLEQAQVNMSPEACPPLPLLPGESVAAHPDPTSASPALQPGMIEPSPASTLTSILPPNRPDPIVAIQEIRRDEDEIAQHPAIATVTEISPPPPATPVSTAVSPDQRRFLRAWSIRIGIAAGLIMLVGEILAYGPLRLSAHIFSGPVHSKLVQANPVHANPEHQVVAERTPPPVAPTVPVLAAIAPVTPTVAMERVSGVRHASITVTESTWATVFTDGKLSFAKLLVPGQTQEIEFRNAALLRFGNAGAVRLTMDGKPIGQIGEQGAVRVVELTPNRFRFLPAPAATPVTESVKQRTDTSTQLANLGSRGVRGSQQ